MYYTKSSLLHTRSLSYVLFLHFSIWIVFFTITQSYKIHVTLSHYRKLVGWYILLGIKDQIIIYKSVIIIFVLLSVIASKKYSKSIFINIFKYIKIPSPSYLLAIKISKNYKYIFYCDDYWKVIDNIYFFIYIIEHKYCFYQNWKRLLSQDILTIYNFNIQFWFILPGLKSSAKNYNILKDIIDRKKLVILNEIYWFTNIRYSNLNHLLIPIKIYVIT